MRQTTYAPVRTRFTFSETNIETTPMYDFDIATDNGMFKLPIIGDLTCNLLMKKFNLSIMKIANGVRLSIGVIPKGWTDGQHANGVTDNGEPLSYDDMKSNFTNMRDVIEGGGKELWKGGPQSLGMTNFSIKPFVGLYMDFGLHYEAKGTSVSSQFIFMGGGGYIGIRGYFRYTFYMLIYGFPVYAGFDVSLTITGQFGVAAEPGEDRTYEALASGSLSFADWDFDTTVIAQLLVNAYVGAGICGTAGIRGGVSLSIMFLYNPTVKARYPEFSKTGWNITGKIKVWLDALFVSIPIPVYTFMSEPFGYFADLAEFNKQQKDILTSLRSSGNEVPISSKPRDDEASRWLGSIPMLQSTLKPESEQTLSVNGYDEPMIRLTAYDSDGNGEDDKVLLVFLDDIKERSEEQRTALKYSIFDLKTQTWTYPEIIQNDGTADFTPDLCDAGDGILLSFVSRDPLSQIETYSDRFTSLEVYCVTFDKASGRFGDIVRLTNDSYYDTEPHALYDSATGDILVHYTKAETAEELTTGDDIVEAAFTMYNKGEPMYMLYDGRSGEWVRDKFYDGEVAESANKEELLRNWDGQRFLISPIEDAGQNNPVIFDFKCASMDIGFYPTTDQLKTVASLTSVNMATLAEELINSEEKELTRETASDDLKNVLRLTYDIYTKSQKTWGVYAYTVDFDNSLSTNGDRELYIQIYDFRTHKTSEPIRITHNNVSDSAPNIVGDYLFWTEGDNIIRYMDLEEELARNLIYEGGKIKFRNYDGAEDWDVSWNSGVAEIRRYEDSIDIPEISEYVPFVDGDGNIYVIWQQMVKNEDGVSGQELYVSTLTYDTEGNGYWADAHRLTHTAEYDDLPGVVSIGDGVLMTVNNRYSIDMESDVQDTENVSMAACVIRTVSSLEASVKTDSSAIEVITNPDGECRLTLNLHNDGMRSSEKLTYTGELYKNGVAVDGTKREVSIGGDGQVVIPAGSSYSDTIVLTGLDGAALGEYTYKVTYSEDSFEAESEEFRLWSGKAEYKVTNIETKQTDGGFTLTGLISNIGSGASREGDTLTAQFNDLYLTGGADEIFASCSVESLCGGKLAVAESKPFSIDLSVSEEKLDKGYVNGYIVFTDTDGERLGLGDDFTMVLEHPYSIKLTHDGGNGVILVGAGQKKALSAEYGADGFFGGGEVVFATENPEVATVIDGELVGVGHGETKLMMTVAPYGGVEVVDVVVTGDVELPDNIKEGSEVLPLIKITPIQTEKETVETAGEDDSGADGAETIPTELVFSDVSPDAYYADAVRWAYENGITTGTGDGVFLPDRTCTRAEAVTFLYRAVGEPECSADVPFADVSDGAYYYKAVQWAYENGITLGTSEMTFSPDCVYTVSRLKTINSA